MPLFSIKLDGSESPVVEEDFAGVDEARNAAVSILGSYLQEHPEYANNRHWRVDLKDHRGRLVLHVVVATVEAPLPLNVASYFQ